MRVNGKKIIFGGKRLHEYYEIVVIRYGCKYTFIPHLREKMMTILSFKNNIAMSYLSIKNKINDSY
jgi:hypothetical protein